MCSLVSINEMGEEIVGFAFKEGDFFHPDHSRHKMFICSFLAIRKPLSIKHTHDVYAPVDANVRVFTFYSYTKDCC